MKLPDIVQRLAKLTEGKPVEVVMKGERFTLPIAPPAPPVVVPDPIEVAAALWLESQIKSNVQRQDLIKSLQNSIEQHKDELVQAFAKLSDQQGQIAAAVTENTRTLHLPVKPHYDKTGKLIGARRS